MEVMNAIGRVYTVNAGVILPNGRSTIRIQYSVHIERTNRKRNTNCEQFHAFRHK